MHITPTGKLAELLVEKGRLELLSGFDVSDIDLVSERMQVEKSHPEYSLEMKEAVAVYSIATRNKVSAQVSEQLGGPATNDLNRLANTIEAQSRGFLQFKGKIDEAIQAQDLHLNEHADKLVGTIQEARQALVVAITLVKGDLISCFDSLFEKTDLRWTHERKQLWLWRIAVLISLAAIAWRV